MGALREHGLRVGADVAVVGYNDLPFSAYLPVPLTSVSSPMYEVGKAAAELLIRKLHGDDQLKSVRLAPHLVARQSTKRRRVGERGSRRLRTKSQPRPAPRARSPLDHSHGAVMSP